MAFEDRFERAEFPFNAGVPVVFNLNRGQNLIKGNIEIDATVTIAGGGTNGIGPIGEGGAVNLVRRIRVIANKAAGSRYPGGALVRCYPQSLLRYAIVEHQGKYVGELTGNGALGNGAAGVYQIFMNIPIYFGDSVNNNNVQTALNMNAVDSTGAPIYSAVQVQVDLAQLTNELFAGNDRVLTVAGMVRWTDSRLALTGDTTPLRQEDHTAIIQAPQEDFVDPAMPNDGAFTSMLFMTQQGTPGWQLSNNILNRIEMQGTGLNFKRRALGIQQDMLNEGFYDPSQSMTGQYFLDWTHGLLANSNAAAGLQHRLNINNPSGAGQDRIRVYTRRVFQLA